MSVVKKLILGMGILPSVIGGLWHVQTGNTFSLIVTALGAGFITVYLHMAQTRCAK
jgi:hypothetical protein